MRKVLLDLHAEEVTSKFFFQLSGIWSVKFDSESQERICQRQLQLPIHWLFQVQPVFDFLLTCVLEAEIVGFQQIDLLTNLLEEYTPQCFGLFNKTRPKQLTFVPLHFYPFHFDTLARVNI